MPTQLMQEGRADVIHSFDHNAALRVTHSNWRRKLGHA